MNAQFVEHQSFHVREDEPLYGFYEKGKFGFFNQKLQIAIPAIYNGGNLWASDFGNFSNGFAMIYRAGYSGFVSKSGMELEFVDPSFGAARHFNEGLAVIEGERDEKRVAGFVDTAGKIVVEPREEFASVGYWPMCTSVTHFACGLALVAQCQDEGAGSRYLGYIDRTGEWVIQNEFEYASDFSEGLASVERNGKIGCIDTSGQWVIEPQYGRISPFVEGLAPFQKFGETKWGVIDQTGRVIVEPMYDDMRPYNSGLALVSNLSQSSSESVYGAIDKSGALVVPLVFQTMTWFHEGLAGVIEMGANRWGGQVWGVINTSGDYVIPPGLGYPFGFRDGLCRVRISPSNDRDTCYIDRTGKVVWRTLY